MLQAANKALEQSNRNLQEFASIASHDLQEPLRKIKTFTGILREKHIQQLSEDAKTLVLKTEEASIRMSALIRDVLNYSRISRFENSFVPTDLQKILTNVVGDFNLMIEEKNAVLKIRGKLPTIEAVPTQINQVFYNLLSNALKFALTNRKPKIEITCSLMDKSEIAKIQTLDPNKSYYRILFSDNGIGFDPQFSEQIFYIFERLNSINEYEGTGIGLALCRKIVNQHGGLIWAEGIENVGSTFYIILPVKQ